MQTLSPEEFKPKLTIAQKYRRLKDAIIWAVTHKDIVNIEGIFDHLKETIEIIESIDTCE